MPTPDRTSLDEIIAVARALLEDGGPSAVTMQAVAQRVGVRAPSLYKRVRDRGALLGLVADATAGELQQRLDATDGSLGSIAHTYRAFAHDRPEGFRLMNAARGSRESLDGAVRPLFAAVGDLVGEEHALDAARLLVAWARGFVDMELTGAFRLGGDVDAAFEFGLARIEAALRM